MRGDLEPAKPAAGAARVGGAPSDTITYYTRDRDTAQNTQYDIGCRSRDLTGEFLLERSYRYVNSRSKIENQEPVDKSSQDLLPGGI